MKDVMLDKSVQAKLLILDICGDFGYVSAYFLAAPTSRKFVPPEQ